jgi:gliding motility-associated-like protein
VLIPGETNASYNATTNGAYYVQLSSGACLGQSSTVNVSFQNLAAPTINVSGTLPICSNETIGLSIPATTFNIEWRLNGTPIAGATSINYSANAAGDYTVRLYSATAPGCTAVSLPVTVTTKPAPIADVSPTGNAGVCEGEKLLLTHTSVTGEMYEWFNNGALISGQSNAFLSVDAAGTYTLTINAANGCTATSTGVTVVVNAKPIATLSPSGEFKLCEGGTVTLSVPLTAGVTYTWQRNGSAITGASANTYDATSSGLYTALAKNTATGCKGVSAATKITMIPPPIIFAGNDTIVAMQQPLQLHVKELTNYGVNQYQWLPRNVLDDPFSANPVAVLNADQEFTVSGSNSIGCANTDKIFIKVYKGPAIYVPTAFTPNKDGKNDLLKCFAVGISTFKNFTIFNRYGQKVFSTSDQAKGWNGFLQSEPAAAGTYVWIAEAVDYLLKPMSAKGSFVLIR